MTDDPPTELERLQDEYHNLLMKDTPRNLRAARGQILDELEKRIAKLKSIEAMAGSQRPSDEGGSKKSSALDTPEADQVNEPPGVILGYCVYEEKAHVELVNPKPIRLKSGRSAYKGKCSSRGKPIFVMRDTQRRTMELPVESSPTTREVPEESSTTTREVIIREVVKIRCRYCGVLNDHGLSKCQSCGAPL